MVLPQPGRAHWQRHVGATPRLCSPVPKMRICFSRPLTCSSRYWHSTAVPVSLCLSQEVFLSQVGAALAAQPLQGSGSILAFRAGVV